MATSVHDKMFWLQNEANFAYDLRLEKIRQLEFDRLKGKDQADGQINMISSHLCVLTSLSQRPFPSTMYLQDRRIRDVWLMLVFQVVPYPRHSRSDLKIIRGMIRLRKF